MKTLTKKEIAALSTGTDEQKISAAAELMIETPLYLISKILHKHETSVFEVIKELHDKNKQLSEELEQTKSALEDAYRKIDARAM